MHAYVGVCTGPSVFMSMCLYVWVSESTCVHVCAAHACLCGTVHRFFCVHVCVPVYVGVSKQWLLFTIAFHRHFFYLKFLYYLPNLLILLFILKNSHFFLIFKIKIYCLKISYVPIICSGQIHSTPPSSVFPFPPPLLLSPGFMSSLYNPLSPLEHGHPIRDCIYQKQSVANSS